MSEVKTTIVSSSRPRPSRIIEEGGDAPVHPADRGAVSGERAVTVGHCSGEVLREEPGMRVGLRHGGEVGVRVEGEQVLRMVTVEPGVMRRCPVDLEEERGRRFLLGEVAQCVQALSRDRVGEVFGLGRGLGGDYRPAAGVVVLPDGGVPVRAATELMGPPVVEARSRAVRGAQVPFADHPAAVAPAGEHRGEGIGAGGPAQEVRGERRLGGPGAGERLRADPVVHAVRRRHPPGGETRTGRGADRGGAEEVLESHALALEPIEGGGAQLWHLRSHCPCPLVIRDQQQDVRRRLAAG